MFRKTTMLYVTKLALFAAIGGLLGVVGVPVLSWHFWAAIGLGWACHLVGGLHGLALCEERGVDLREVVNTRGN